MSDPSSPSSTSTAASYDKIKTHFPSARIKKLMQSDEDVGKVASATPIVVGRALELFLCSLVEKSCVEAKENGSRRITPMHIKNAVNKAEEFDFCIEVVDKYK